MPTEHRFIGIQGCIFGLEKMETFNSGPFRTGKRDEILVGILTIFLELVPYVGVWSAFNIPKSTWIGATIWFLVLLV